MNIDKTKIAIEVFDKRAVDYQEKFMNVDAYADTFNVFCKNIQKNKADVLEIACGPGNVTKYLLKKKPDLKILGTDLAPNMVRLAKINNPGAEFQVMDCREINMLVNKYDAIMCGFCLPYLSKEESIKLILDASNLLHAGGILYISTMEDDYSKSGFRTGSKGDEIYMHFHEAEYLTAALHDYYFKIVDLQRQEYAEQDGTRMVDLIIIAKRT